MATISLSKSVVDSITEDGISKLIKAYFDDTRYNKLHDYYIGKHSILSETKSDSTAPNNKVVANMAKYITDTATGYFIGSPVIYSSKNINFMDKLNDIYSYNDEQDTNAEIAKECSIYGHCFEMLYTDEQSNIRFQKLSPQNVLMIYQSGYDNPVGAIRRWSVTDIDNQSILYYEFWNEATVWTFKSENDKLSLIDAKDNLWHDIPFVEYINNEERMGDFEGEISIMDTYNKAISNSANMFQYNDEAILKLIKLGGDVKSEDVKEMKEQGAIVLDDGGDIDWLLKTIDDTALENHKNRLRQDLHSCASVPNLSDEAFGGNLSGVAVSYKLWNLEQICAMKERKFKKGLQRRIELICNVLINQYDYRDITIQFRRNKPQNILEIAQIIQMLSEILSKKSRLKMLPMVENVEDELNELDAELEHDIEKLGSQPKVIGGADDDDEQ